MATEARRTRARWTLAAIVATVTVVVAVIAIVAAHETTHSIAHRRSASKPPSSSADRGASAERALAVRPMPTFPPEAAQPHTLTTRTDGPAIQLPRPSGGRLPATPAGALAQLTALDETAMVNGDPASYARTYRELSLPGAPNPASTGLSSLLTSLRAAAGLPATGPVPGLLVDYQVTEALVKGSLDGGRYIVACVLGELTVQKGGPATAAGVGDCQALRWTAAGWRISAGPLAAPAPCTWPGSAESVRAGYRELS
jgi:hypothetical protein